MSEAVWILCSASCRGTHYSGVPDWTWLKESGAWGEKRMNVWGLLLPAFHRHADSSFVLLNYALQRHTQALFTTTAVFLSAVMGRYWTECAAALMPKCILWYHGEDWVQKKHLQTIPGYYCLVAWQQYSLPGSLSWLCHHPCIWLGHHPCVSSSMHLTWPSPLCFIIHAFDLVITHCVSSSVHLTFITHVFAVTLRKQTGSWLLHDWGLVRAWLRWRAVWFLSVFCLVWMWLMVMRHHILLVWAFRVWTVLVVAVFSCGLAVVSAVIFCVKGGGFRVCFVWFPTWFRAKLHHASSHGSRVCLWNKY